jgi:hypothetical protein
MPDTRDRDVSVDELRQRLRSLGYLDAGVDRFVLGAARETRRPPAIALYSSLRIGVLAALLLGPAAAVGLAGRLPGLVTGPVDAMVVAAYLGVLFGGAVAIAALAASLVVWLALRGRQGTISGRTRSWAVAAGASVTMLCLAYLTLWWQTANAGLGWSSPWWTLFALAVAVAISLLLGHAVVVAALAVAVAGAGTASAAYGVPAATWRVSLGAGAAAFVGAALLLVLTAPESSARPEPPPLTVVSSGLRLRIVAIDGVDSAVFDELAAAGQVPALARAFAHARAALAGDADGDPARTWTTVATGQPADLHGVRGIEIRSVAGLRGRLRLEGASRLAGTLRAATDLLRLTRPAIVSGHDRREKTFWEVAAGAGLRTAVINWWATWPAGTSEGTVLTDRATLRLERGGELDAEIAPATLYAPLREKWPAIRAQSRRDADAAVDGRLAADIRAVLLRSAELDAMQLSLASIVSHPAPDLLAVYLPGLDIAQYSLLRAGGDPSASAMALRVDAIRAYYSSLDRLVAGALEPAAGEVVLVVTTPGRAGSGSGRLALSGSVARRGASIAGSLVDVAPTTLHLLGVPVSRELAGRSLGNLLDGSFSSRYPVRFVDTYGSPGIEPAQRSGQPLDQEMIERLRSLGYVR